VENPDLDTYHFARQRVLLIEDDEEQAVLLRVLLRRAVPDISVFVVASLKAARTHLMAQDRFGDQGERSIPSLIILDLGLPDGSGFEMLDWLKKSFSRVPVFVLTASDSEEDRKRSFDLGAHDFRTKPEDFQDVIDVIVGLLDEFRDRVRA